jgi:hypothetical protein
MIRAMMTEREFALLHSLQSTLALKRDWVAVGHLQALIDRISSEHGGFIESPGSAEREAVIH